MAACKVIKSTDSDLWSIFFFFGEQDSFHEAKQLVNFGPALLCCNLLLRLHTWETQHRTCET